MRSGPSTSIPAVVSIIWMLRVSEQEKRVKWSTSLKLAGADGTHLCHGTLVTCGVQGRGAKETGMPDPEYRAPGPIYHAGTAASLGDTAAANCVTSIFNRCCS